jgi:radical SAM superfamily enzyme YgiQ (UPF0313 family)
MKVGFYVQAYEHIGVECLSAMLKGVGHTTSLYFDPRLCTDGFVFVDSLAPIFNIEDMLVDQILEADLDLLCFSIVTDNYASALRVAAKVKQKSNIPIVFGGIHCTSVPERVAVKPQVDYVVVGEGEHCLVELCDALANGTRYPEGILNLWYQRHDGELVSAAARPTITDLDTLPFLDKDIFYDNVPAFHQKRYSTAASRGCVYACTFCNNSMYKQMYNKSGNGRWQRRRSVDNLMEELRMSYAKYKFEYIYFFDEIFIDNRDWLAEFADKYGEEFGLPFFCYGYARFIDKEVVEILEKAGCRECNIGVQTIREYTKKHYLKRGEKNERVKQAIALMADSSIYLSTGNILECPGQPVEEALELAEFYNDNRVDLPLVSFLRYYPRNEIVTIALDEGILTKADVAEIEEAAEERPFFKTTSKDGPSYRKIRCVIQLTPWAPKPLVRWLIKSGAWKAIPSGGILPLFLQWLMILRSFWTGKYHMAENYTAARYLWVMAKYGLDKVRWKFRKRRTPPPKPESVSGESATEST